VAPPLHPPTPMMLSVRSGARLLPLMGLGALLALAGVAERAQASRRKGTVSRAKARERLRSGDEGWIQRRDYHVRSHPLMVHPDSPAIDVKERGQLVVFRALSPDAGGVRVQTWVRRRTGRRAQHKRLVKRAGWRREGRPLQLLRLA